MALAVMYCATFSDTFRSFGPTYALDGSIASLSSIPLQYSMSLDTYFKVALIKYQQNGDGEAGWGLGLGLVA